MSKPKFIQAEKLIGTKAEVENTSVNDKDTILYALGIGFSHDPTKQQDFRYTNETDPNFAPFPTMAAVVPHADLLSPIVISPHVPQFNPFAILHAEHKITMFKPKIQIGVEYQHEVKIIDCVDKGKNAFILYRGDTFSVNQKGDKQLVFSNELLQFIRGLGGFKYEGKGFIKPLPEIPQRKPDHRYIGQTYPGQAFLYRLSGDANPLHIDPDIAKGQNFQRPILHGLATYGTIARVIVQNLLKNDSTRLGSIRIRFVGHVYPGETLDISVWKIDENNYIYEAEVRNRKTKAAIGLFETREAAKL